MASAAPPTDYDALDACMLGNWEDSLGNSVVVSNSEEAGELTAVLTPQIDHKDAKTKILKVTNVLSNPIQWRCGNATLESFDEQCHRLVWATEDGRRSIWSRIGSSAGQAAVCQRAAVQPDAFPWLLNNAAEEPWLPLDVPRDILYDGARIVALLDVRQIIGGGNEAQERLTHILMDHDLDPMRQDYLVPSADSPVWRKLPLLENQLQSIQNRIRRIPSEALLHRICWHGHSEVWVGRHKICCRPRDVRALSERWTLPHQDERKRLEIARLLALYSVFDNPLSNRRNGVHLGLDPAIRKYCDYELFASPLNAAVANGRFASKWPHVEWKFGSIGTYPYVLGYLPVNAVVCVNPPFTEAYLANVMGRLRELKKHFRLRMAMPIHEAPWRGKLGDFFPMAQLLKIYYDASGESHTSVLHPTLLWEDPRCPPRPCAGSTGNLSAADSSTASEGNTEALLQTPPSKGKKCADTDGEAFDDDADKETDAGAKPMTSSSSEASPLDSSEWPALLDIKDASPRRRIKI